MELNVKVGRDGHACSFVDHFEDLFQIGESIRLRNKEKEYFQQDKICVNFA
jgi:hypothetical protein